MLLSSFDEVVDLRFRSNCIQICCWPGVCGVILTPVRCSVNGAATGVQKCGRALKPRHQNFEGAIGIWGDVAEEGIRLRHALGGQRYIHN